MNFKCNFFGSRSIFKLKFLTKNSVQMFVLKYVIWFGIIFFIYFFMFPLVRCKLVHDNYFLYILPSTIENFNKWLVRLGYLWFRSCILRSLHITSNFGFKIFLRRPTNIYSTVLYRYRLKIQNTVTLEVKGYLLIFLFSVYSNKIES